MSQVQDRQVLDIVAGLLQVNSAALEASLCTRKIQTGEMMTRVDPPEISGGGGGGTQGRARKREGRRT